MLAQALFPAQVVFWPFLLIERLLRFGGVRTTSRVFYSAISRHPRDIAPQATAGQQLRFDVWDSMARGYRMLLARDRAAEDAPGPDAIGNTANLFHVQALRAACANSRFLEAFEIGLLLTSDRRLELPLSAEISSSMLTAAAVEAVHQTLQGLPEIAGLCLEGFDETAQQELRHFLPAFPSFPSARSPARPGRTMPRWRAPNPTAAC
ncbi:MAG: hypothetical protein WDO24_11975 [Pseudomonadota bacterium]